MGIKPRETVRQLKMRRLSSKVIIFLSTSIKFKRAKIKIKNGSGHQNKKLKIMK